MTDCIFVYGSLLSAIAHPMGERLRREAALVGAATISGRLFRVSWYPAVRLDPTGTVHGEVYRLTDPAGTLAWLDEYEGIVPGPTGVAESDEYERRTVAVRLATGDAVDAWVYLYRRPVDGLNEVPSGRWTG